MTEYKMKKIGVRLVRLTSGEEILCSLMEGELTYRLLKPHVIIPMDKSRIGIMPWLPYAAIGSDGIDLSKDSVMFIVKCGKEMESEYMSATTGLITAPAGLDTSKLKLTTT